MRLLWHCCKFLRHLTGNPQEVAWVSTIFCACLTLLLVLFCATDRHSSMLKWSSLQWRAGQCRVVESGLSYRGGCTPDMRPEFNYTDCFAPDKDLNRICDRTYKEAWAISGRPGCINCERRLAAGNPCVNKFLPWALVKVEVKGSLLGTTPMNSLDEKVVEEGRSYCSYDSGSVHDSSYFLLSEARKQLEDLQLDTRKNRKIDCWALALSREGHLVTHEMPECWVVALSDPGSWDAMRNHGSDWVHVLLLSATVLAGLLTVVSIAGLWWVIHTEATCWDEVFHPDPEDVAVVCEPTPESASARMRRVKEQWAAFRIP